MDVLDVSQTFLTGTPRLLIPPNTLRKVVGLPSKLRWVLLRIRLVDLDVRCSRHAARLSGPQPQTRVVARRVHRNPALGCKHLEIPRHLRAIGTASRRDGPRRESRCPR